MADSSNTARNFILTGVLLGVGAAAAGVYVMKTTEIPQINTHIASSDKTPSLTRNAVALKNDALAKRELADIAPEGAVIPRLNNQGVVVNSPRYTPLFFAPKLWEVTAANGKKDVRDLLSPASKPVYAGVANTDFFKYGMEELLGRADALDQDTDGDGFTNREEFAAKTNPNDKASMPPFASEDDAKMVCADVQSRKHTLILDSSYAFQTTININVHDGAGPAALQTPRKLKWDSLQQDSTFGLSNSADEKDSLSPARFKIVECGTDSSKGKYIEVEDTYTKVEAEKRFRLYPGSKGGHEINDVTAELVMTAGAQKGSPLPRRVQLNETFDVPGFAGVQCTLTKASPRANATISVANGGENRVIKLKKLPTPKKNKP